MEDKETGSQAEEFKPSEFEKELFKEGAFEFEVTPEEAQEHKRVFEKYVAERLIGDTGKPDPYENQNFTYKEAERARYLYDNRRFEPPGNEGYDKKIEEMAKFSMKLEEDRVKAKEALFNAWCAQFSGKIPKHWGESKNPRLGPQPNIHWDIVEAAKSDVQLSPPLLDAAVTYPTRGIGPEEMARAQKLNPFQLAFTMATVSLTSDSERNKRNIKRIIDAQEAIGVNTSVILEAQKILQEARQGQNFRS